MVETKVVQAWIEELGFQTTREEPTLLHVRPPKARDFPPFFVQCTENWVLLSVLPVLSGGQMEGLHRRMLELNREMKICKFALGPDDEVVLCAELPTEALDASELKDAASRIVDYLERHRDYLLLGLSHLPSDAPDGHP